MMAMIGKDIAKGVAVVVVSAGILWGIRRLVKTAAPHLLDD